MKLDFDGWSHDINSQRYIGIVLRLATIGEQHSKDYLVDLVPVEGRESGANIA